jgi:phage-related protein
VKALKQIEWKGTSKDDIADFPIAAKKVAGTDLMRLQSGLKPKNGKPFKSIGANVFEIKIKLKSGAYRVMYCTKAKDSIIVLHCFEKKSQKTSKRDIDIAKQRYKTIRKK